MQKDFRHLAVRFGAQLRVHAVTFALILLIAACSDTAGPDLSRTPTGATLSGHVYDADTRPVPGVRVLLQENGRTTTTDSDGGFTFRELSPRSYSVELSKTGFGISVIHINLQPGETRQVDRIIIGQSDEEEGGTPEPGKEDSGEHKSDDRSGTNQPDEAADTEENAADDSVRADEPTEADHRPASEEDEELPGEQDHAGNEPTEATPKLVGPTPTSLILSGERGKVVSASMEFSNTGSSPLTFRLRSDRELDALFEPAEGTLEPGEKSVIIVSIKCSANVYGTVKLETNDSRHDTVAIPVSMTCSRGSNPEPEPDDPEPTVPEPEKHPELDGLPPQVSLNGTKGETSTSQLQFRNNGAADLEWELAGSGLNLNLQPRSGKLKPGQNITVQISSNCSTSGFGSLMIISNDPDRPHTGIPVTRTCRTPEPEPDPEPEPGTGSFSIELIFASNVPQSYRQAVTSAANRWSELITEGLSPTSGTLPACNGHPSPGYRTVQNVLISVKLEPMDEYALGYGGFCAYRRGNNLPTYGTVTLNTEIDTRFGMETLEQAALHEIGHVLGLGTLWDMPSTRQIDYAPTNACINAVNFTRTPKYNGAQAKVQFASLTGGAAGTGIPLESALGPGSRCSHWDSDALPGEIMIAVLHIGRQHGLSRVTAGGLADLGYSVDYSKADQSYSAGALATAGLTGETVNFDSDFVRTTPIPMMD